MVDKELDTEEDNSCKEIIVQFNDETNAEAKNS